MWITSKEHALDWGGKSNELERKKQSMVKLPFDCCNLGLTTAKDPYCTADGIVFDLLNIVPYFTFTSLKWINAVLRQFWTLKVQVAWR